MPSKYDHINFKPPSTVANAAKRGLKMRAKQSKSNQGGTAVGLARANQLAKRKTLSPSTVKRMKAFFDRHQKNKKVDSGKKAGTDKGQQAWLLWGGDAGRAWATKVVNQMEKADNKKPVKRALNPCGMTKGGTFDKGNSCAGTKGKGKGKSAKPYLLGQDDKPRVLYHRTSAQFDKFKIDPDGPSGAALFFGEDKDRLPNFHNRKKQGDRIIKVNVRAERPLVINKSNRKELQKRYAGGSKEFPFQMPQEWKDRVIKGGFDSIIIEDLYGSGSPDEVIVFDSSQVDILGTSPIKRALNPCGMTKGGTFDKGNTCAGTKGKSKREKLLADFKAGKITASQLADELLPPEERKSYKKPESKTSSPTSSKPVTEGQKTFFKDSKVRNPDGELLKVFHGTRMKFDVFTNPYGGWNMFSDNFTYSQVFARGDGEVGEYYLNIKRPLDLRSLPRERGDARNELIRLLKYKAELDEDSINYLEEYLPYQKDTFAIINQSRDLLIEILIDHGYDGIVMPDVVVGQRKDGGFGKINGDTYIAFVSNQIKKVTNETPTKANEIDRALNPCGMTDGGTFAKGNSCAGTKGTGKKAKEKSADQKLMTEWSGIDNAIEDASVGENGTRANEPREIDHIRMEIRHLTNTTRNRTPEFIKAQLEKEKAVWDKGVALLGGGEVELSKMDSEQVQELLQYIMDNDGGYFTSPHDFDEKLKQELDKHKRDVEELKQLQAEIDEYESTQPPKVEFKTGEPFVAKTYHGTPYGGFETFDKDQQGVNTKAGSATLGWFFAGSRETAQGYAGTSDDFPIKARGWSEMGGTDQQKIIDILDGQLKTKDENGNTIYASDQKIKQYINENPDEIASIVTGPYLGYDDYDTTPVSPEVKTAFIKMENPYVVDQEKADYREQTYYDLMLKAIADGHDGIVITNTYDSGYYDTRSLKKSQLENIFAVFDKKLIKLLKERAVKRALNPCGMTEGGTFDKGNSCAGTKGTGEKSELKKVRPKKLVQNLKRAEAKIRNERMEFSHNFDAEGNLLFIHTSESTQFIKYSKEQMAQLKDSISTHNHPTGGSFSPDDVNFAIVVDLKEIRAVSKETGYTFVLQRPKNGWNESYFKLYQKARKKISTQRYGAISVIDGSRTKPTLTRPMGKRFMSELVIQEWITQMQDAGFKPDDMPKYYELIDAKN